MNNLKFIDITNFLLICFQLLLLADFLPHLPFAFLILLLIWLLLVGL